MKVTKKTNDLYRSRSRINVLKGGAGSGKSVGATQVEIRKGFEHVERVLVVRKVARTLRDSCFKLFKDILSNSGFIRAKHYEFNSTSMFIQLENGTEFIFAGLDDVDKLKSIAGISRILIEEADQISEDDFDQLDLRLRGENLHFPQITLLFNPVSQSHWLKRRFFDQKDADVLIIESNYLDNPFLDEGYIKRLKALEFTNPRKHRIYVKNEWGIEDTTKLFIRNFGPKHIQEFELDPNLDIHLAWDLNYDPTCLVIQITEKGFRVRKAYHDKGLTLPYVCATAAKEFPANYYWINGDASGHFSRNQSDHQSSYEIIKNFFRLSWNQLRVPKANPKHRNSRLQCNAMFDFAEVLIHPDCVELIADIESAIVDDKESLDPWKKDNPERSHWLDALRYHINAEHQELIKRIGFEDVINN